MGKKRHWKGGGPPQAVSEDVRIKIYQQLQKFRYSTDDVYVFDSSLSNEERAVVHEVSRKLGLKSKSFGKGAHRCVRVHKSKKKNNDAGKKESLSLLALSAQAKEVLQDLFTRHPPDDASGRVDIPDWVDKLNINKFSKDEIFRKPSMSEETIAKKLDSISDRIKQDPSLRQVAEERSRLPITSFKDSILSTVESHQVVLLCGETGCGKTTQVPQFLLDSMWAKGKACKIVCTQPRRISATSVAERISYERGENIGNDIGYKIRLDTKGGRNSSIVFCTNGVVLRMLVSRGFGRAKKVPGRHSERDGFEITHIIVDEIHERDRYSDLMLPILRDMLPSNPNLRLILMSATINTEQFSSYFGGCPIIRVPGFTYPVKSFYLEDVLSILNAQDNNHLDSAISAPEEEEIELTADEKIALDDAISSAWLNDEFDLLIDSVFSQGNPKVYNYQHSETGMTPLMVFAGKGRADDMSMLLSLGADCHLKAKDGATALDLAEHLNHQESAELIRKQMECIALSNSTDEQELVNKYLATVNPESVDDVLVEKLLKKICWDSEDDGAILVFLPGWDDINKIRNKLQASPFFKREAKFRIFSLHSMIPAAEQKKVFQRQPRGCRKIILSTNIAETSITIDDVVYVVDSGRMKEKNYDPYNNVCTLQSSWVSKANARQREGRAGRCQVGICYHLYSKVRAASLPDFQVPEIKRTPIEDLCLQVKIMDPDCKIEEFLLKTLDPPVSETIQNAVHLLKDIGALSDGEKLTLLGEKLGSLPVHPSTGKMLFFAILMNCLDPALTVACASDYKSPFTIPMSVAEKQRANNAKAELASQYNGNGDQLAVIAAFECWKKVHHNYSSEERKFCSEYFISSNTMYMLNGMRKQLERELVRNGFIPVDASSCSLNAHDPGIVHSVLVAGLYPQVGRLWSESGRKSVEITNGEKIRLLSLSTKIYSGRITERPMVVYDEIIRGDSMGYIRNCTVVGPLPVMLLASDIAVVPAKSSGDETEKDDDDGSDDDDDSDEEDTIKEEKSAIKEEKKLMSSPEDAVAVFVDGWLPFKSIALDIAQIYCLREQLLKAILFKVTHPREVLPPFLGAYVYAVACILSFDGLSGIPKPKSGESLTSMVDAMEIDVERADKFKGPIRCLDGFVRQGLDARSSNDFRPRNQRLAIMKGNHRPKEGGRMNHPHYNRQPSLPSSSSYPQQRPNEFERRRQNGIHYEQQRKHHPLSISTSKQAPPPPQGASLAGCASSSSTPQRRPMEGERWRRNGLQPSSIATPNQAPPPPQGAALAGYVTGMYGPYGRRGDSMKRQRG